MNNVLRTTTPIGMMEVDIASPLIVNLIQIKDNLKTMHPNKVIYPCVIKDLMDEKGRQVIGWTTSVTIHEDLLQHIKHVSNILLTDDKWEAYPATGGDELILHHERKG